MDVLTDNFSTFGDGFLGTVQLTVYSSILALALGFLMASFRVAPVGSFRSVIPPVGSTLIALAKNSAIAGAFSVTELLGTYKTLSELGYSIIWTFIWIAIGYLIITLAISAVFNILEKRWGVAR
ncbi:hypothetical protein AB0O76_26420 [Streptomyces sp. NPDC086554]|uniref:hypothetical protein n=1 Tax=Streptomyces sp. NPDC086554 TaxID=3154864 RepID=UPI00343CF4A1